MVAGAYGVAGVCGGGWFGCCVVRCDDAFSGGVLLSLSPRGGLVDALLFGAFRSVVGPVLSLECGEVGGVASGLKYVGAVSGQSKTSAPMERSSPPRRDWGDRWACAEANVPWASAST